MRKSSAVFGCLQSAKSKTISQNISHKKSTNTILSYNQQPHMLSKNAQHYCIKRNFPIIVLRLNTQKKKQIWFIHHKVFGYRGWEGRKTYWVCKTRPHHPQIRAEPRNPPTWVRLCAHIVRPPQILTLFSSNRFLLVPLHTHRERQRHRERELWDWERQWVVRRWNMTVSGVRKRERVNVKWGLRFHQFFLTVGDLIKFLVF